MPGGKANIQSNDGTPFTAENQPKNRRKSTKFLTDLLTKNLKIKKDIEIEGYDIVTGAKIKIRVPMPNRDVIVQALLRQAAKGNTIAIGMVWDRIEGKAKETVVHQGDPELPVIFKLDERFTEGD